MAQKYFVVDTNVLLHDPASLLKFEDNILVVSPIVLQELDKLKGQNNAISADARQVIRMMDKVIGDADPHELRKDGVKRNEDGGFLMIPTFTEHSEKYTEMAQGTNDQKIIRDALLLKDAKPNEEIAFVSKDINARLIAKFAGLKADDYKASEIISDLDEMRTGTVEVDEQVVWDCNPECKNELYYFDKEMLIAAIDTAPYPNLFIILDNEVEEKYLRVVDVDEDTVSAKYYDIDNTEECFGINPIGIKQAAAINTLADPDIPLVMLTGNAGSGKTLVSLAMGLEMAMEKKEVNKVIAARAAKNLDEEIGFLPGTESEKVGPWLGAIQDNIEVLFADAENVADCVRMVEERYVQYKSINFMRGRSIQNSWFLLDEAQNLTPHQIKTLVTRMGEGSKIVVLGDLAQIDNHLLSQYSSGLTHLIERMAESKLAAHIHLEGSPRSELAEQAGRLL